MAYTNPGKRFLERFGPVRDHADVMRYVEFLRAEAGLGVDPPIDLSLIYRRFEIPPPALAPLPGLQGLLVNSEQGIIFINERDIPLRRRFTEAHELIELLFAAQPLGKGWAARRIGGFKPDTKEQLCNEGAAELLMPRDSFAPRLKIMGISFQTAHLLAQEYKMSTTAALVQMVRVGKGHHAVVLWRMKNKPMEIRQRVSEAQLSLFGETTGQMPRKKLRVEWSFGQSDTPFIPRDKSVSEDTSIYAAYRDSAFTIGMDSLDFGPVAGKFKTENQPFESDGERQVVSLLHLHSNEVECGGAF